ncbi:hypothetical protein ACFV0R_25705 [Streptomyces sp. NPDC059578]|uniref:hypothetical protein n=1 Tax=Streptomyces sp. NPDC059578 TaxID=3346874 RepID=UPI0036A9C918
MHAILTRPRAGVVEDVEREDDTSGRDGNGYEAEDAHRMTGRAADDACGLCGFWTCRCGRLPVTNPRPGCARGPRDRAEATTAPPLPIRPTPHERDGRQEQEQDSRPHPQHGTGAR